MKSVFEHIRQFVICAITLFGLVSCDVHEWPEIDYGDVTYTIDLRFDGEMPFYKEVLYARGGVQALDNESRATLMTHDVRFILNAYPAGTVVSKRSEAPFRTFVFTDRSDSQLDRTVNLDLPEGKWDIYVWTDYVDAGSQDDKYYDTSDFSNITYTDRKTYSGSNVCREAFRGMATVEIVHPYRFEEGEVTPAYSTTIPMHRPMGRFDFISTDVDEFLKQFSHIIEENKSRGDVDSKSLSRADLEDFKVVFRYTAFMPSVYNAFTDKPIDSWTGISFESSMDVCDDGIILGFDHLLVNGSETIANIALEVYDGKGEKIASTPSIEVPVVRGKYTVVKGEFLSSSGSGGVTVNPGFDGEYNIEIK